ncbi:MAG: hypothetical protein WCR72_01955 [Bacteroidota bacterium]
MTPLVDYNNDYRNFSEIDYLLGSNLAGTPSGLNKAMQRLQLFDLSKRHIPYLLLIHKVLYNIDFPEADKKEAINKLLAGLYREVIHKNSRKQLTDFFPSYFVYRLLVDLYIAGYKIERVLRGVKDESDAIGEIIKYGDFSSEGFPRFLWSDLAKYKHLGKYRGEVLHTIALKSLFAGNMGGFYFLLDLIKEYRLNPPSLIGAVAALIYRDEIDQALKITESEPKKDMKSACYMDLSNSLAQTGKIDMLLKLKHSTSEPEFLIGILCGLMNYHFKRNELALADKLLEEAFACLDKIKSNFIRTLRLVRILAFIDLTGDSAGFERCIKEILLLEQKINGNQKDIVRRYFCRTLIQGGHIEQAKEYANQWHLLNPGKAYVSNPFSLEIFFQVMMEEELTTCDLTIRCDRLLSNEKFTENAGHYYKSVLEIVNLIQEDDFRGDSLLLVADRMAVHGFYNQAIKVRDSIKKKSHQSQINSSMPMHAIANGDISEALYFAEMLNDEKTRLAVQLCMTPHLEKLNHTKEASVFIREWADYTFKNT